MSFFRIKNFHLQMKNNQIEAKIVLLGDSNVGKTSIINRALTGAYDQHISPTLGANYSTKICKTENSDIRLQIWDTAGEEKYRSLVPMFFRGAEAAILVYSIDDRKTFDDLHLFVKILDENSSDISKIVVGNKSDLSENREIEIEEGGKYADSIGASFIESSAKYGDNVDTIFETLSHEIVELRTFSGKSNETAYLSIDSDYNTYINSCKC
ncbi:small GTP-binding protein [Tritrichomonas foetus]|uniref:Small GTP-binding protein n=1 Tax=Tritrichomonas foetus TaxID=1144522 RepID=A0A1J4K1W4_9EUKA|nr:small GTP-binding protein [Tritrichomonas foetus]|eukprot:OHT05433.1 small GTP-binding protein [Tritrichomonas foetus]